MVAAEEAGVARELLRVDLMEPMQVPEPAVGAVARQSMEVLGMGLGPVLAQALAR